MIQRVNRKTLLSNPTRKTRRSAVKLNPCRNPRRVVLLSPKQQQRISVTDIRSGDYEDELTNAALLMYLATYYLDTAKSYYDQYAMSKKSPLFSRNRVQNDLQLMMYIATNDSPYLDSFENGLARWGPDWIVYTRKGLAMYTWNRPMKRDADISFLAFVAAKHGIKSEENFNFASSQIHYMLGDGGRSYLTSFGRYPPLRPHHRAKFVSFPDRS
ncbi:endoglucanase 1-like [Ptychodera flava]|uniref:endoglucanase 1-like n=1 Tax=Ptychodera flava TaxID=63121 RepID=UPI00396A0C17